MVKTRNENHGDALRALLRRAGIKITPIRLEVLGYLLKTGQPVSHSDVQSALPTLDRVTIYRTLASFVESGIAHQVQGLDGMWHFCAHNPDSSGCPGNHPHFLCTSCGKMICLLDQNLPRVDVTEGNIVNGKQFVAYGFCQECAAKAKCPARAPRIGDESSR
ncbi:MAG: transcriptional repressor [Synergistaceae bacterium]|nr:transcriptional repressor [Synergistaceae bacterium]